MTSHIIPILEYRILSSGNIFNPNPLIKVTLHPFQKRLKDVGKLSIGQCLTLLK